MTILRALVPGAVALFALSFNVSADPWNKLTRLEISEPVQIPGATLQPGEYVVRLADSAANRHIVRFFNEDQSKVIATILAIPNQRMQPTGDTQLGFYETPVGQPPALRSWFYPGDNFGQQFVYPRSEARDIARQSKRNVPAMDDKAVSHLNEGSDRADSEAPAWDEKNRVYAVSPDDKEVAMDEGMKQNQDWDKDPAWKKKQTEYSTRGKFSEKEAEGTRARKP